MRTFALLFFVVACGSPSSPSAATAEVAPVDASAPLASGGSSASSDWGSGTGTSTGTRTGTRTAAASSAGCVEDAQARTACGARGAGFSYGPQPYIYCSGVAPDPKSEQAEHARIKSAPCQCVDNAAVAKQRHECSRIPSAAPHR